MDQILLSPKKDKYSSLKKIFSMKPEIIIKELEDSGLRGRGGAGFPTGKKWAFVKNAKDKQRFVVVNADESEPGTFKDRLLLLKNFELVLEGLIIAGYAVGATQGFIFLRGEFVDVYEHIVEVLKEAYKEGMLGKNILGSGFDFEVKVYRGSGAYMSGEETALLESMEGKPAWARGKPPFPAQAGFLGKPTLVNNVETLANVPWIVEKGGNWYASIGTPESPGIKLFALSGSVNNPGVYELPMGITLRELIYDYGGGPKGGEFFCALPGSVSSRFVTDLDVKLDYYSLEKAGSMLGSGAVVVFSTKDDIWEICERILEFFYDESCGFCAPCRVGSRKALEMFKLMREGKGEYRKVIKDLHKVMMDACNCGLGQFALCAVDSAIDKFNL